MNKSAKKMLSGGDQNNLIVRVGNVRRLLLPSLLGLILVLSGCSSAPPETETAVEPSSPTAPEPTPTSWFEDGEFGPTPLAIPSPTVAASNAADDGGNSGDRTAAGDGTDPDQTSTPNPTATPRPTSTPRPIPTAIVVSPTPQPAARPAATATPRPAATATPRPAATATPGHAATATPPPTVQANWVNPDCYVGTGAADEPVWWCGGKICAANAPHYGCPTRSPAPTYGTVSCTISNTDIVVDEVITLRAHWEPINLPVRFAFSHGDGTIDNTPESRAFYRDPGTYPVTLLYQYDGGRGSVACGNVRVRALNAPTPTATPIAGVQIGCTISPQRPVQVGETLRFTAFQDPSNVPVAYVFDHGDGTLDETAQSYAFYNAPGSYEVRLRWAHGDQSGTTFCGTVTVDSGWSPADYVGLSRQAAESLAVRRGVPLVRILRIDDQVFIGTQDYRLDRLNWEIDANVVTRSYVG